MPERNDLKRMERNAYLAYFQDGIWDVLLGIALLTWGLAHCWEWRARGSP